MGGMPEDHQFAEDHMPPGSAHGDRPMDGSPDDIAARAQSQGMLARGTLERPRTAGRRPPKVQSKVTTAKETTAAVAPAAVITEGSKDDDEEDMFEAPADASGGPALKVGAGEQHEKLVRDLLA